jgi:2-polyprenyl-3-methyl-5-hydroxy-6-metoxy-1,4-benzoquinol methylase
MENKGVLDKQYAIERLKKPELNYRFKTRARFVKNTIQKHLGTASNLNILDFGAAEGLTMIEMHNLIPESSFLGIEYSEELIGLAPTLPSNIRLIKGDVTNLSTDIVNNRYDVVCALALLEHLKNPLEALQEANKVLKSGGLFIASSPNPFWDHVSSKLGLLRDEQHEVDMNKKLMLDLVKDAGMELIAFKRFMWAPVSFLPYLKIKVSPSFSLKIDDIASKLFVFNWLFVNQAIIARKK